MMGWIARLMNIAPVPILNLFYWFGRLIPGLKKIPRVSVPLRSLRCSVSSPCY